MSINYPESRNDPLDGMHAQDGKPTTHPVYRVAWRDQTSFTPEQREWIAIGVNSMIALGPTFIWWDNPSEADFAIGHWPDDNSPNATPAARDGSPCGNAGEFIRVDGGPDRVHFDPAGIDGEEQWTQAAAHETGHFLGMDHDTTRSPAIMDPSLASGTEFASDLSAREQLTGQGAPRGPTRVDFDNYDRSVALGRLPVPRSVRRTVVP